MHMMGMLYWSVPCTFCARLQPLHDDSIASEPARRCSATPRTKTRCTRALSARASTTCSPRMLGAPFAPGTCGRCLSESSFQHFMLLLTWAACWPGVNTAELNLHAPAQEDGLAGIHGAEAHQPRRIRQAAAELAHGHGYGSDLQLATNGDVLIGRADNGTPLRLLVNTYSRQQLCLLLILTRHDISCAKLGWGGVHASCVRIINSTSSCRVCSARVWRFVEPPHARFAANWHYLSGTGSGCALLTGAKTVRVCWCRHDVALGPVGHIGLRGSRQPRRLLAHKQHSLSLPGAHELLQKR